MLQLFLPVAALLAGSLLVLASLVVLLPVGDSAHAPPLDSYESTDRNGASR